VVLAGEGKRSGAEFNPRKARPFVIADCLLKRRSPALEWMVGEQRKVAKCSLFLGFLF
jgi:hypothetical protein